MQNAVSVILPYYNRADSLKAAASSVLGQTHVDLVLILVNDGSTDASEAVARSIEDERVVHRATGGRQGASFARNIGLETAGTALVAFMDSDDLWLPQKLEKQIAHLRTAQEAGNQVSVVGCGWRSSESGIASRDFRTGPFTRKDMLRGVPGTGTPMILVDRSVAAEHASFDVNFPALEERDYILTCLGNGSLLEIVPETLAVVQRGRADHVANAKRTARGWERFLDKYTLDFQADPQLRSWYHYRAAREHLLSGKAGLAKRHLTSSLAESPGRRTIHLALTLLARAKGAALAQRVLPL